MLRYPAWNHLVEIEWRVFATPGVVIPIHHGKPRIAIAFDEDWAVVAAPRFVGRNVQILDVPSVNTLQHGSDELLMLKIDHVDSYAFRFTQRIDHLHEDRHYFIVGVGETNSLATRPGEPGCCVRLPLGRHPISLRGW